VLREKSCGVVPYRDEGGKILYLVISSAVTKREHWEFPKGGVEEGEREVQTALRELQEETGVSEVRLLPGFREPIRYIYRRPEGLVSKQVVYFIGKVANPAVTLREVEAKDYRWATYDETYRLIRHANARILLERVHAFITGKPRPAGQERRRPSTPSSRPPAPKAPPQDAAAQPAPVQPAPVQPAPTQPTPVQPTPVQTPPSAAAQTTPQAPSVPSAPPQQHASGPSSGGERPSASTGRRRRRRRRRGKGSGGTPGQGGPPAGSGG